MDQMTGFASALTRLDSALDRLERAADSVGSDGSAQELSTLRERHRQLRASTERAVADLDALIASARG